jgi:tetratricopeptide (TPR) repeat protein
VAGEPGLAAGVAAEAGAGEIWVSASVRRVTEALVEYEEVGAIEFAGERQQVFRLVRSRRLSRRNGRGAFVGRRNQIRQVRALLAGCLEDGRGTAICIRGEAGLGKTRLLSELEAEARALGFDWLSSLVYDFGVGASDGAITALAAGLVGARAHDVDGARAAVERAIDASLVPAEMGPFLLDVLEVPLLDAERQILSDVDGRSRAELRVESLAELVKGTSRHRPLVLSLEDIHGADSVTLAFVARLIAVADEARCVLLVTTRSDGDPLSEDRRDFPPSALVRLELGPLRDTEAHELLRDRGLEDQELAETCVERAGGNPLFLEGLLDAMTNGEPLPARLEDLLLFGVERLPAAERGALDIASVLGQRFELETLRALLGSVRYEPGELVERMLVEGDAGKLEFRHALVRTAVYGALGRARREELHSRAAAYYEGRDAVLHAEHLELGGRPAALAYLDAAEKLLGAYQFERASRLLDHAMGITHDANELYALAELRGRAAIDAASPDEAAEAYERALGAAGSDRERCEALIGLGIAHRQRASHDAMLSVVARASALAEEFDWPLERAKIHYLRGSASFALGRPGDSVIEHEAALRLVERVGDAEWKARALSGIGDAHYALGQMTLAEMHFEQAALCCEAHGFARFAAPNRLMIAMINLLRGDTQKAVAVARRSLDSADAARDRNAAIMARHLFAMAHLLRGEYELGQREALSSLEAARRSGSRRFDAESLALLAIAERCLGRSRAALRSAEAAVASARKAGLAYSGPIALGALAVSCEDRERARRALEEGDSLLRDRPIAHNGFWFSLLALRYAVATRDVSLVERHARFLGELARRDHLIACELAVEVARAAVKGPVPATLVAKASALGLSMSLLIGSDSAEKLLD